jgi:hypothetical protein
MLAGTVVWLVLINLCSQHRIDDSRLACCSAECSVCWLSGCMVEVVALLRHSMACLGVRCAPAGQQL